MGKCYQIVREDEEKKQKYNKIIKQYIQNHLFS